MSKEDIIEALMQNLQSFINDPADTDYQRGYEEALKDFYFEITGEDY